MVDTVVELQEEEIKNQARSLELQRELIFKQTQEVKAMQNTVKLRYRSTRQCLRCAVLCFIFQKD